MPDNPYPPAPPPPSIGGHSDAFKIIWQAVSRVALFGVGTVLVFLPDATDVQVTTGSGLMIASAGLALAKGLK